MERLLDCPPVFFGNQNSARTLAVDQDRFVRFLSSVKELAQVRAGFGRSYCRHTHLQRLVSWARIVRDNARYATTDPPHQDRQLRGTLSFDNSRTRDRTRLGVVGKGTMSPYGTTRRSSRPGFAPFGSATQR